MGLVEEGEQDIEKLGVLAMGNENCFDVLPAILSTDESKAGAVTQDIS